MDPQEIFYSTTSYKGYEKEILRLLNLTRGVKKSKEYLNWRYQGLSAPKEPMIFWAHKGDGTRVGVISVIFREFWVHGKQKFFAVGGDLSIDPEMSGRGIAKGLTLYMTQELEKNGIHFSCGIANPASQKVHSYAGWSSKEDFIRHVLILNPAEKINKYLKIKKVSQLIGMIFREIILMKIGKAKSAEINIQEVAIIDDDFSTLWGALNKEQYILCDRDRRTLSWRYGTHPLYKFIILKFFMNSRFIAYIIYSIAGNNTCKVYDLACSEIRLLPKVISSFIKYIGNNNNIWYIWILLNKDHPYSDVLSRNGFIKRKNDTVFHCFDHSDLFTGETEKWFLTAGDKDI